MSHRIVLCSFQITFDCKFVWVLEVHSCVWVEAFPNILYKLSALVRAFPLLEDEGFGSCLFLNRIKLFVTFGFFLCYEWRTLLPPTFGIVFILLFINYHIYKLKSNINVISALCHLRTNFERPSESEHHTLRISKTQKPDIPIDLFPLDRMPNLINLLPLQQDPPALNICFVAILHDK